jgi:hypothetical protein
MAGKKGPEAESKGSIPIVGYKGSAAFAAWLNGLADHVGVPVTVALDLGLKALAEKSAYLPAMPRRIRKRVS